jgi:hypothetical protein
MTNLIEVAGGGAAFVAILGVAIVGGILVSLVCLAITARATS